MGERVKLFHADASKAVNIQIRVDIELCHWKSNNVQDFEGRKHSSLDTEETGLFVELRYSPK